MPVDFPNSPTVGTIVTFPNGQAYRWNGGQWDLVAGGTLTDPYTFPVADMQLHSKAGGQTAFNSKKDGTGTDVATISNQGNLNLAGANGGITYNRLGGNTFAFKWNNALYYDVDIGGATSRIWADALSTFSGGGNGYHKFPTNLMIQWGSTFSSTADFGFSWPTAFPNAYLGAWAQVIINPGSTSSFTVHQDSGSTGGINWRLRRADSGGAVGGLINCTFIYLALGY